MDNFVIFVDNVSKFFNIGKPRRISNLVRNRNSGAKTLVALDGISFSVKEGEVLGLIGLNGSGKSTLLRIIADVYKPDHGSVQVKGNMSSLMQIGAGFQNELDARENIIMNGMLLGLSKSKITSLVEKIIQYAELENFLNLKLKHYSSGMRARLAFSTAMQIDSDILLVDEILSVGDKDFQKKSFDTFNSLKKDKKTIVHATHNLNYLLDFSDRVLLLHKGKKVMIGKPDEVIKKYREITPTN